jgi:flagellar hook-associated protein 1 FlgK
LIQMRNTTLPTYMADLNRLAAGLADGINAGLAAGVDANGNAGAPLFSYNLASDAASSLRVTGITTAELAAATSGSPGGNGNALDLADLVSQPKLDGLSYTAFYGQLATRVGQAVDSAKANQDTHPQLLLQARSMRDDLSGVSLDEEAARLMEFQRAYEATAQMIAVLNQLTQETLNILRL